MPIVTVAPARKPLPRIVTGVPPAAGPELGSIALTCGALSGRPKYPNTDPARPSPLGPPSSVEPALAASATLAPNAAARREPAAFGPLDFLLCPGRARAREPPCASSRAVVARTADQCRVAVGRERRAVAEAGFAELVAGGQLRSLLLPSPSAVREHPGGAGLLAVGDRPDQCRVAAGTECDAPAEATAALQFRSAGQLAALFTPAGARARKRPRRARVFIIAGRADERHVAGRRERDRPAEMTAAQLFAAGQAGLLDEPRGRARERPHGADVAVIGGSADERRLPVAGQCDAAPEAAARRFDAARQLSSELRPVPCAAREDPRRAGMAVGPRRADQRRVAVAGKRDASTEAAFAFAFWHGSSLRPSASAPAASSSSRFA